MAFKSNPAGLRRFQRELQGQLDNMQFTVPIEAESDMSIERRLPDDQDKVLQALFDMRAFETDMTPDEIADVAEPPKLRLDAGARVMSNQIHDPVIATLTPQNLAPSIG